MDKKLGVHAIASTLAVLVTSACNRPTPEASEARDAAAAPAAGALNQVFNASPKAKPTIEPIAPANLVPVKVEPTQEVQLGTPKEIPLPPPPNRYSGEASCAQGCADPDPKVDPTLQGPTAPTITPTPAITPTPTPTPVPTLPPSPVK